MKAASQISKTINTKRAARGLKARPVRACVIGFPNVGKSALINRLIKKRACESAPRPGVTRNLKWVRVGGDLDLLDAPGIRLARSGQFSYCLLRISHCFADGGTRHIACISFHLVG